MSRRHQSILNVLSPSFSSVYSFQFDGVDEYIESGVNMTGSDITLSYWVNANGTYPSSNAYYSPVAFGNTSGTGSQSIGGCYKPGQTANLHAGMQCFDSTNSVYTIWTARGVVLEGTGWHHILWTFNNTTKHTYCYIDGAVQTFTHYSNGSTTPFLTNRNVGITTPVVMGTSWANGPQAGRYFDGLVDEVSIFKSILSQTDINTIYGTGIPSDISSLNPFTWLRMGEEATFSNPGGVGNWTLTDQGSGSNNATSVNMEELDRNQNVPT
jgi:hypothetical protein